MFSYLSFNLSLTALFSLIYKQLPVFWVFVVSVLGLSIVLHTQKSLTDSVKILIKRM